MGLHHHGHGHHGHHHGHSHGPHPHEHHLPADAQVISGLRVAFLLNLSFTVIEVVGGLLTNSMAVLADAVHDLGDTAALGSAVLLERYSQRGSDERFSYGYRRFSPLSAWLNALILSVGSVFLLAEAIPRLLHPQPVHSPGMVGLAVLGIAANGLAVWRLSGGKGNANQRVMRLHLLEDVLGWVAVLVSSVLIYFTGWNILDPILSLTLSGFILFNAARSLLRVGLIFLQAVPPRLDSKAFCDRIAALPYVLAVHDLHVWSLDGEYHILSLHIVVPDDLPTTEAIALRRRARELAAEHGIHHYTFEMEYASEDCAFADCGPTPTLRPA